ncbi:hypothetical protein [Streptomyces thermolilacinus]|uniref:hypothetical protein n=1 Tax=Streptomyces thermolilacinus TaxID=285540 RepID=UPI00340105E1
MTTAGYATGTAALGLTIATTVRADARWRAALRRTLLDSLPAGGVQWRHPDRQDPHPRGRHEVTFAGGSTVDPACWPARTAPGR